MSSHSDTKQGVQAFGRTLSAMVMPNIGAFIAWGFITALFIDTGWLPNATLSELVGPMITYLLPLLIGYTGGKNVYDIRGGVIGAVATMGVVVGADVTMFIGAMIMGPLAAILIKQFDKAVDGKIPAGFEMLVNNFSLGILGAIVAILGNLVIGPVVQLFTGFLSSGVNAIVNMGILPLISIFVEPAKVLFLNNAINHGIFGPLGVEQVQEVGKSIFFLVESNPGPGLGVLLAYWMFAKGSIKESAPGAVIIHFFGGIHEIYFPYILMNPALILAVIAGGAAGVLTFSVLGAGLMATPSPGSIFAIVALAPRGGLISVLAGVIVATAVSFVVASYFVKRAAAKMSDEDLQQSKDKINTMKVESKGQNIPTTISKIIYACDAGMGSSAMGATMLGKKLKQEGIDILVKNFAINDIPDDASIVISHEQLTDRAKKKAPGAYHISVTDFLDMSVAEHVKELIAENGGVQKTTAKQEPEAAVTTVLNKESILLGQKAASKDDAIRIAGKILVEQGYVEEAYIESMVKREQDVTTYIGRGVAIPHGLGEDKKTIKKSGVSIVQFPEGVSFGAEKAYLVIGIAGKDNEHLNIIGKLAEIISSMEEDQLIATIKNADMETLYKMFGL